MQAWRLKYSSTKDYSKRWTAGILALSKEDALKHLSSVTKFPYSVEAVEYLGEIHAITEPILMATVKSRQKVQKKEEQKEVTVSPEPDLQNIEVECQYCGKVCKGSGALENHESKCKMNPDFAKLERARQDRRKEKLAAEKLETPIES